MDHLNLTLSDEQIKSVCETALIAAQRSKDAAERLKAYKKKMFEMPPKRKLWTSEELLNAFGLMFYQQHHTKWIRTDLNDDVLDKLVAYFSGNESFEQMGKYYSLKKGLLLQGKTGCGKTSMIKCFQGLARNEYSTITCRKIESIFDDNGQQGISKYAWVSSPKRDGEKIGWFFDDLGAEDEGRNYGKASNVMRGILTDLAENGNYQYFGVTTNLSMEMISESYGERVADRFKSMFNIISFPKEAPSMRG